MRTLPAAVLLTLLCVGAQGGSHAGVRADAARMQQVFDAVQAAAADLSRQYGTRFDFAEIDTASPPAPTDPAVRDLIAATAEKLGYSYRRMPSGAGHDAQDLATITPTGMIFVPSVGGISHSPEEFTSAEDMARGASVLLHSILAMDDAQ